MPVNSLPPSLLDSSRWPSSNDYRGRFAPSPTGPLHLGSLMAAVASYLDARAHQGQWLVRMEDIDPPRVVPGSADNILKTLEVFSLEWDGAVMYQSQRDEAYEQALEILNGKGELFKCACSRQHLRPQQGKHLKPCSYHGGPFSLRLKAADQVIEFEDRCQGLQRQNLRQDVGDFILKRKDGLYAYQLAVVVDDHDQRITHVVRGADLLDSTQRQIYLQHHLTSNPLSYCHFPVLLGDDGHKLSKQAFAAPVDAKNPMAALKLSLKALGQDTVFPLKEQDEAGSPKELLSIAIERWDVTLIPSVTGIPQQQLWA